jgi:cell wall-associated NlpC family hydrolase
MIKFDKYIGIPYKYKGSDFSGCDCFGLISLIARNELGIILLKFWYKELWYESGKDLIEEGISKVNVTRVVPPYKLYDALIFYNNSRIVANHIGLFIRDDKFIHTYINNPSRIDRLEGYWQSKLYGAVRYKGIKI